jgi:ubiquinone/menaquinone biosynthesis C-methylase UbiE
MIRGEDLSLTLGTETAYNEARLQYLSPSGLLARLQLYPYAPSHQEYFENRNLNFPEIQSHLTHLHYMEVEAMKAAGIAEDATIVSLATGDGSDTILWPAEFNHKGRVIGVNLDPIFAYGMHHAHRLGYEPVDPDKLSSSIEEINKEKIENGEGPIRGAQTSFEMANAAETGLPDNSVDGVTINNLFHHANPDEVLAIIREVIRITKYGGTIGMLGRDVDNMHMFWTDVPEVVKKLGAQKGPESFYKRFGIRHMITVMRDFFTPLPQYDYNQEEYMRIPGTQEGMQKYFDAFFALMPNIEYDPPKPPKEGWQHMRRNPTRAEMAMVLKQVVTPRIEREVNVTKALTPDGNGFFQDGVAQYLRLGVNNKWKSPDGKLLLPR